MGESPAESPPPSPPPVQRISAGQAVFHNTFGQGTVLSTVDQPHDQELTIDFSRHGQKRLLASMAKLAVLDDPEGQTA
jgi:DNA helicase-2/ATP-dependent DNA helicase PcrA